MAARPLEHIAGTGHSRIHFEDIDLRYHLKMRAFIGACMAPIFTDMERHLAMRELRGRGITPIMFYLIFENSPTPLRFGSEIETRHEVRLRRAVTPDAKAPGGTVQRLLLEMDSQVWGQVGSGNPHTLGTEPGEATLARVGRFRGMHVLTRPTAPPGERQVTEVPPELRGLQEQPLATPFPTPERIAQVPDGFAPVPLGAWEEQTGIWGLPNTDINQHVNVHEYIYGMENHFTRLLYAAKLPLAQHRIGVAHLLFRKPFFAGGLYVVRGRLFTRGQETVMASAFHQAGAEGEVEERPSVAVRMEGVLEPGGAGH